MPVPPLTPEEIKQLERNYDRLMQMAGELDRAFYELNLRMMEAYARFSASRAELDSLKMEKSTLTERARLIGRMLSKF